MNAKFTEKEQASSRVGVKRLSYWMYYSFGTAMVCYHKISLQILKTYLSFGNNWHEDLEISFLNASLCLEILLECTLGWLCIFTKANIFLLFL